MLRATLLILQLLLASFAAVASEELQLNTQATLFKDVKSITHDAVSRHVTIHLTENRACINPTFMVRLSGPSLYLLDRTHDVQFQHNSVNFGYPPLIDEGQYYLEVLSLFCDTLNADALQDICLVSPLEGKNILNVPYRFDVPVYQKTAQQEKKSSPTALGAKRWDHSIFSPNTLSKDVRHGAL